MIHSILEGGLHCNWVCTFTNGWDYRSAPTHPAPQKSIFNQMVIRSQSTGGRNNECAKNVDFIVKGCFKFQFDRPGTQGRNLETETEAQTIEEDCLLACFSSLCSACFPLQSRNTKPGMSPPTLGWAHPHDSGIKKTSHRHVHRPVEETAQLRFPLPRYVKLTSEAIPHNWYFDNLTHRHGTIKL